MQKTITGQPTTVNSLKAEADLLLASIGNLVAIIRNMQQKANAEIEAVKQKYGNLLAGFENDLKQQDKALVKLMKAEVAEIFDGKDLVKLRHGTLLHTKGHKVRIPRDALAKIEAQGWSEAIMVHKSVKRPVVEGWPDERLAVIGAERRRVESFSYEVWP